MSAKKQTQNLMEIIKPGAMVKVYEKIKDVDASGKEKERTQVFEGTVLAVRKAKTPGATFVVRKISEGIGVEKIYPLYSPLIEKVAPVRKIKVRRAKLYYLKNYKKRIKEEK